MKKLLLTGAGGFIGSHVLAHILTETNWDVVATDSFRHKGKTDRIVQTLRGGPRAWRKRIEVITHDLQAPFSSQLIGHIGHVDYVIAMASESHVDRSIADPAPFVRNNVDLILNTLDYCRVARPESIIVMSTDEVYGPLPADQAPWDYPQADGHQEWSTILPSNPYAASKAAQEAIAIGYWRTYGLPLVITNTMNVIGEMQDREKFVPRLIQSVKTGRPIQIHGTETNIGSRHYLHARNAADGLLFILRNKPPSLYPAADRPDRYNIAGVERISNLDLGERVAKVMGKPLRYKLVDFHSARPGHDPHYGLNPLKLAQLGWKPPVGFNTSLATTVNWTLEHPGWLD